MIQVSEYSLYIHFPWCEVKCPYCDFNSHVLKHRKIDEASYIDAMLAELTFQQKMFKGRALTSIFLGGGTPSIITIPNLSRLINGIDKIVGLNSGIEFTIEANPESITNLKLKSYRSLGINRISIGAQTFNNNALKRIGRIHTAEKTFEALNHIQSSFDNFNIDLMYAIPGQSINHALFDIEMAMKFSPKHISWYQFTLEPKTHFYKVPPKTPCPNDKEITTIEKKAYQLFTQNGFNRYEISAFAMDKFQCKHNLNYWNFGDYIGIGAGSSSKFTDSQSIIRKQNIAKPSSYINHASNDWEKVSIKEYLFEYMLNKLRLYDPINLIEVYSKTGISPSSITPYLNKLKNKGFFVKKGEDWSITELGQHFYNDLVIEFLID